MNIVKRRGERRSVLPQVCTIILYIHVLYSLYYTYKEVRVYIHKSNASPFNMRAKP